MGDSRCWLMIVVDDGEWCLIMVTLKVVLSSG